MLFASIHPGPPWLPCRCWVESRGKPTSRGSCLHPPPPTLRCCLSWQLSGAWWWLCQPCSLEPLAHRQVNLWQLCWLTHSVFTQVTSKHPAALPSPLSPLPPSCICLCYIKCQQIVLEFRHCLTAHLTNKTFVSRPQHHCWDIYQPCISHHHILCRSCG